MELKIGGVYLRCISFPHSTPTKRIVRILCTDDFEYYYEPLGADDVWWSKRFHSTFNFLIWPIHHEFTTYEFQYLMPFTDLEQQVLRPDLPMRMARIKELSWNQNILHNQVELSEFLRKTNGAILEEIMDAGSIMLWPFPKKGAPKPAKIISADNGKYFTAVELLVKANAIRAEVNDSASVGVGIFRSGIKSKLPSYYIGDYIDRARNITE
jgi:hypothetical protein